MPCNGGHPGNCTLAASPLPFELLYASPDEALRRTCPAAAPECCDVGGGGDVFPCCITCGLRGSDCGTTGCAACATAIEFRRFISVIGVRATPASFVGVCMIAPGPGRRGVDCASAGTSTPPIRWGVIMFPPGVTNCGRGCPWLYICCCNAGCGATMLGTPIRWTTPGGPWRIG